MVYFIYTDGIIISSGIIDVIDSNVGNGEIFSGIGGLKLTVITSGIFSDI